MFAPIPNLSSLLKKQGLCFHRWVWIGLDKKCEKCRMVVIGEKEKLDEHD
jgi:hypothetical protein